VSQFTNYEPIKQGPTAKLGGYFKYFDNKIGKWIYQYLGPEVSGAKPGNLGFKYPNATNFYEIDDIKQRRIPQEAKKSKKISRKP
jgi:hypothetical protein